MVLNVHTRNNTSGFRSHTYRPLWDTDGLNAALRFKKHVLDEFDPWVLESGGDIHKLITRKHIWINDTETRRAAGGPRMFWDDAWLCIQDTQQCMTTCYHERFIFNCWALHENLWCVGKQRFSTAWGQGQTAHKQSHCCLTTNVRWCAWGGTCSHLHPKSRVWFIHPVVSHSILISHGGKGNINLPFVFRPGVLKQAFNQTHDSSLVYEGHLNIHLCEEKVCQLRGKKEQNRPKIGRARASGIIKKSPSSPSGPSSSSAGIVRYCTFAHL